MKSRQKHPVAILMRWREFQEAITAMRFEVANGAAAEARERRQQSLDAENELRAERARLLDVGSLDLGRLRAVSSTEANAAETGRRRQIELEKAEAARSAAQRVQLRARAELKVSENRWGRIKQEREHMEEHRAFDAIVDTYLQKSGERR